MKKKKSPIRGKPRNKTGMTFSLIHKVLPIIIIIISMVIATQKCAREINYDEDLIGKPWFIFKGEPFYPFYAIIFVWIASATKFKFEVGDIVYGNLKIIVGGTILAIIIYYILVYVRSVMNKDDAQFLASGEWGDKNTLKAAGLLNTQGVVLGQLATAKIDAKIGEKGSVSLNVLKPAQLIQFDTNVCAMLMCPSRSGKGVSTVSLSPSY